MVKRIVPLGTELNAAREYPQILAHSAPLVVETNKTLSLDTMPRSPAEAGAIARARLLEVRDLTEGCRRTTSVRRKAGARI